MKSDYDPYAAEYSASVAEREAGGVDGDPYGILPHMLPLLGELAGRRVLPAAAQGATDQHQAWARARPLVRDPRPVAGLHARAHDPTP
jgi:hypothetical protein